MDDRTVAECIVGSVAHEPHPPPRGEPGTSIPRLHAAGLDPDQMLMGYVNGAFPMDEPGCAGPVCWYTAEPRAVIVPAEARIPATVRRMLRRRGYEVRVDTAFAGVVDACGGDRNGTWLTPRLAEAYGVLHAEGWAHSVEAWDGDRLAGGLFGVWIGNFMSAESMFHALPDGGNAAIVGLIGIALRARTQLIDVQMESPHVMRFGARGVGHEQFLAMLDGALEAAGP